MDISEYIKEGNDYLDQLEFLTNRLNEIIYVTELRIYDTLKLMKQDKAFNENLMHLHSLSELIQFILKCNAKLNSELSCNLRKVIEDYEKFVINGKSELFIEKINSGYYVN